MKQERTGVSQVPRPHKWPGESGNTVFFPEETNNRFKESTCFLPLVPACAYHIEAYLRLQCTPLKLENAFPRQIFTVCEGESLLLKV